MWPFEQPLVILFVGAFCFAVAAAIWLQTRQRTAAIAVVAVLAITALGLLVERLIVTDSEQVRRTLNLIARQMEQDDMAAVLDHISSSAPAVRDSVQTAWKRFTVQKVSIKRNLKVSVVRRSGGTGAEARFNAVATVRDRAGLAGTHVVPRRLIVRFRLEGDAWKVVDYQLEDPREGLRGSGSAAGSVRSQPSIFSSTGDLVRS